MRGTAAGVSHEESKMIGKLCWHQSRVFALSKRLLGRERLFTAFVGRTNKVRFIVDEDDAFLRLDRFLMAKFDIPMKDVFKIIRKKEVKIDPCLPARENRSLCLRRGWARGRFHVG